MPTDACAVDRHASAGAATRADLALLPARAREATEAELVGATRRARAQVEHGRRVERDLAVSAVVAHTLRAPARAGGAGRASNGGAGPSRSVEVFVAGCALAVGADGGRATAAGLQPVRARGVGRAAGARLARCEGV